MTHSREGIRKAIEHWSKRHESSLILRWLCVGKPLVQDRPNDYDRIHIQDLAAFIERMREDKASDDAIVTQIHLWSRNDYGASFHDILIDAQTTGVYRHYYAINGQLWGMTTNDRAEPFNAKHYISTRMLRADEIPLFQSRDLLERLTEGNITISDREYLNSRLAYNWHDLLA